MSTPRRLLTPLELVALISSVTLIVVVVLVLVFWPRNSFDHYPMPMYDNGVAECMAVGTPPNPNQFTPEQIETLNEVRLGICESLQEGE